MIVHANGHHRAYVLTARRVRGGIAPAQVAAERRVSAWLLRCGCRPEELRPGHDERACREQLDRDVDRILGRR